MLTVPIIKSLEGSYIGFARGAELMHPRRKEEVRYIFLHLSGVLSNVGLESTSTHIGIIHNTVEYWVVTGPILDLCQRAEEPEE